MRASKRGIARGSVRAAVGVVALGIALAAVAGATVSPLPGFSVTPLASTVVPVPTEQQRICPGPLLDLASNSGAATSVASFGTPSITFGTGAGDQAASSSFLTSTDDTAAGRFGAPRRITVPVLPGAKRVPEIAASQTQVAGTADMAGLAAAACAEPSPDSWLVGGSSALGETSILLLTNPSSVQATVNLTVYGESGPLDAPGSTGIEVAPGTQRAVPLAGLAPSVVAPVIHVQTTGGQVLASIQQSDINGITPLGVDLVGPTGSPATRQVISGMRILTLETLQAEQSGESYPENLPAARVLDPGTKPATVRIGIVGEAGTAGGNSVSQTIQPGVVTEIPLDHLADGDFTVTVESDQPVVVAARTTTQTKAATDFAWYVASQPVSSGFLVAVAKGPQPTLHLANAGTAADTVTVTSTASGRRQVVTVPAGAAHPVALPAPGMYSVASSGPLVASLSYSGPGALASFAINPPGPLATPITVYAK